MATLSTRINALTLFRLEMDWCLDMIAAGEPELAAESAQVAMALALHAGKVELMFQASDLYDSLTWVVS
jgi:hypothetical protein